MSRPEELFEPFGHAVVTEIQRQMRRSGTLGPLLRQLSLPAPRSFEEQLEVLLEYLEEHGSIHFLNEVSVTDPANVSLARLRRRTQSPEPSASPPSVSSPTRPVAAPPPAPGATAGVESAPGAPSTAARKPVEGATYSGPDRRSGEERRQGPRDRRQGLETVFTNRRYGGWDRRKETRREEDRAKKAGK